MLMPTRTEVNLFTPPEELERQRTIRELLAACREQLRRCRSKEERKDIISTIKGYEYQLGIK